MMWRRAHPREEHLLEGCLAERWGEPSDERLAAHLADCRACADRYEDLARLLEDIRAAGAAETDEAFPAARLRAARRQIARRIGNLGHVARVISFPARRADRPGHGAAAHAGMRWVAAAAVAGLLAGLGLGALTGAGREDAEAARMVPAGGQAAVRARDAELPRAPLDEDAFLQELETAGGSLRARALMPFDAFTPSVRDTNAQLR